MNLARAFVLLAASLTLTILFGCGGSGATQTVTGAPIVSATASVSTTALTFPSTTISQSSATQTVTLTNTGATALSITGVTLSGATVFTNSTTCGTTLAVNASCVTSVTFTPTASGTQAGVLTFYGSYTNGTLSTTLTGTGSGTAGAAATADCSVASGTCGAALPLQTIDPLAAGGFHGYADPSFRKDPNSSTSYLAYSWARTLADGTHVVDLHLAQSANGGTAFTYLGPLYQSAVVTQTGSTAYNPTNYSSTETVDLLPIPLTGASAGQTLWVQAHQSYLVKPQADIYAQLNPTDVVSVSAVQLATPTAATSGTSLLALGAATTGEARLGVGDTDATRSVTQNLATLNAAMAHCGNFGQPALWYQGGVLYLTLECTQIAGQIDANELAHFVFSTTPAGTDASKWTWAYVGEVATMAQAGKFGALSSEGVAYQFFTEPEYALTKSGQLILIMTPSVFAPQTAQQPVIQYGCRAFPVTLTPTSVTLLNDPTTSTPVSIAKTTESDLYTGVNEGPAACTYEPNSNLGIIMAESTKTTRPTASTSTRSTQRSLPK